MTDLSKYKQPFDPDWPHGHFYGGYPARIVATDAKGERPIVALIYNKQTGLERCEFFHEDGTVLYTSLINAPAPKRTWWVNVYNDRHYFSHPNRDAADRSSISGRIACIKVTEGEGLEDEH